MPRDRNPIDYHIETTDETVLRKWLIPVLLVAVLLAFAMLAVFRPA